jgi:hypothetical protein
MIKDAATDYVRFLSLKRVGKSLKNINFTLFKYAKCHVASKTMDTSRLEVVKKLQTGSSKKTTDTVTFNRYCTVKHASFSCTKLGG